MRQHRKLLIFLLIWLAIFIAGLFLPATPASKSSLLNINIFKDSILKHTPKNRLVLIGGSNLSMGLNSELIKKELKLNPINLGLHANLGLQFMLENAKNGLKSHDTVLLSLEHSQLNRDINFTSAELFYQVIDVNSDNISSLTNLQLIKLIKYIPEYSISKFNIYNYINFKHNDIYSAKGFNEFGDATSHWKKSGHYFSSSKVSSHLSTTAITALKKFHKYCKDNRIAVFLTFPIIDEISYQMSLEELSEFEKSIKTIGIPTISNINDYHLPMDLMFDTRYHLTKKGSDIRTKMLISDFVKNARNQ